MAVVGPALNRAILHWLARRAVGTLLGWAPSPDEVADVAAECQHCAHPLEIRLAGPVALLPSVVVAGRCLTCRVPRPRWFAVVEVATGALYGLAAFSLGWSPELPAVLVLLAGLVAVSAVDLVCLRIPTTFVHVAGGVTLVAVGLAAVVAGPAEALVGAAIGGGLYAGFLGIFYLVSPAMLGLGDVRLAALIGTVVGWLAWTPDRQVEGPLAGVLAAAIVAGLVGTLAGTALLVVRRQNRPFPFGPAMAVGAIVAILTVPGV